MDIYGWGKIESPYLPCYFSININMPSYLYVDICICIFLNIKKYICMYIQLCGIIIILHVCVYMHIGVNIYMCIGISISYCLRGWVTKRPKIAESYSVDHTHGQPFS